MSEIENLISEYNRLGIREQLDYDKFYLYSIITHSTAIEGSTISEIENQLLFDEGLGSEKPIAEQLMNLDLKAAYERLAQVVSDHERISIDLLCELSGLVMKNTGSVYNTIAGTFSSADGELRLLNVSAGRGGRSYIAWQKVPDRLNDFCLWLNDSLSMLDQLSTEDAYVLSFESHYRLVSIHPWADGNGRMARLIMNLVQWEAGLIPSIVKKDRRIQYIKSLADSQSVDDDKAFIDFMLRHHSDNIREQIDDFKKATGYSSNF